MTDLILKDLPSFDFDLTMHVGDLSYAGIVRWGRTPQEHCLLRFQLSARCFL